MVWGVIKRVYSRPVYVLITFLVAALTLSVLLLFPNRAVLIGVLASPVVSMVSKTAFFLTLYGSLVTNFTVISAVSTVLISFMFGVNAALLTYYVKRAKRLGKADRTLTFTGFGGFVSGVFGIGCAACGTIILTGIAKLIGIAGLLTLLPLHGAEFGIVGVALLGYTAYSLAQRINDPLLCTA